MSSAPDVIVVGAGAAGLSAASVLRRAGRDVLVLEAHETIGGRARTIWPDALGGALFDEGATWLHQIDRNPLVDLARAAGEELRPAHGGDRVLFYANKRLVDADANYANEERRWRAAANRLVAGPDRPLSAVGDAIGADSPWLPNIEMWEASVIAAADADSLSLHDWHRNELADPDLLPARGMGTLVRALLGPAAGAVRCGVSVRGVDWSQPGRVRVRTDAGEVEAGACIVTVSTGVLRDERIRFHPAMPASHLAALDGLPMGLLSKLALPVAADARFALTDSTLIEPRLGLRDENALLLSLRADGAPLLTGFLGGRHAWSLSEREDESLSLAREQLAALLGADALRGVGKRGAVSRWGGDPLFRGAYAYALPGFSGARVALGVPFADGRVVLAGEATETSGLAGTVGGAIAEGARAAASVLQQP